MHDAHSEEREDRVEPRRPDRDSWALPVPVTVIPALTDPDW